MQLETAKAWGMVPSQWDQLELSDQAEMLAFEQVSRLFDAYTTAEAKKDTPSSE